MNRSLKKTGAAGLAAAALVLGSTLSSQATDSVDETTTERVIAVGLGSDGKTLSRVDLTNARRAAIIGKVTGLVDDIRLVGIDVRPKTGVVYGIGNKGGIYTIAADGKATRVVSGLYLGTDTTTPVSLAGSSFGVDFNPSADRLRVISNTGQSLRINVETGSTAVDGSTNINEPDPAVPGATRNVAKTGIEAVAYINNVTVTGTGTTLYDLDAATDTLFVQNPPNAGTVVAVGALGIDFATITSFDIRTTLAADGTKVETGYFVATTTRAIGGPRRGLYTVDLATGASALVRPLQDDVASIAVPQG